MKAITPATRAGPLIKRSAPGRQISGAARNLRLQAQYHLWAALQWPFQFVFWAIEQRRSRIADSLQMKGWSHDCHGSPIAGRKRTASYPCSLGNPQPSWQARKSCRSPFRDDRNLSFSVFEDYHKWKDHATGQAVPIRKPHSQDIFRVHPSEEYRVSLAAMITLKDENDMFLLLPSQRRTARYCARHQILTTQ